MKEMFHKIFFVFLLFSLFSNWLISGSFCLSCIEIQADEGSCTESCEPHSFHEHYKLHFDDATHNRDNCQLCNVKFEKYHTHQKLVFTLTDKPGTRENPLLTTALAEKNVSHFKLIEIGSAAVSSNSINLSLESLLNVVMLE